MKKMRTRMCALAAACVAGWVAAGTTAQAQAWIELRTWGEPRYIEEAPVMVYREAPRVMDPSLLSPRVVRRIVERHGFDVIGPIRLRGDVYVVPVEDMRGRVMRVVVDAIEGEFRERLVDLPPRQRGDTGPFGDRSARSVAPQPPLDPYLGWGRDIYGAPVPPPPVSQGERAARERLARQAPDGLSGLSGPAGDSDIAPRRRSVASPPVQAARPKRTEPGKPAARKPHKPVVKKPTARTRPDDRGRGIGAAASPPITTPSKAGTVAARPEKSEPTAAPSVRAQQKRPGSEEAANGRLLRRPAQTGDAASSGDRRGVAEGPVVSSGAAPQRGAPRVVYPGPAPAQPSANSAEQ